MEWLWDPTIWAGLLTLVVLEIVLGIDNLIFIAILADKLPPHQRDRARLIGLSLALIMRLGLLTVVSWLVTLTNPLLTIGGLVLSGRDLILLLGGIFLLIKATTELHERLDGTAHLSDQRQAFASFGVVVMQIVVLDAVFSLDAVITAVGMVDDLPVMMAAVVISMVMMMWASKPLTRFVNAHPTVVVLCLSFLLMIGFSLSAEGLGFKIPKGYLYAAIGFSILIEGFNQIARRSLVKREAHLPLRERTAGAVLRLMGHKKRAGGQDVASEEAHPVDEAAFGAEERGMVSSVLTLGSRTVRSIMTPRTQISWIDLDETPAAILQQLQDVPHNFFPACRGDLDTIAGVVRAKDLMACMMDGRGLADPSILREPVILPGATGVLDALETLRRAGGQLVLVADEYGTIEGLLTPIDILEAIAGEFPDEDEQTSIQALGPDRWRVDGGADLYHLSQALGVDALSEGGHDYASIAGLLLERFGALPQAGDVAELHGLRFEVLETTSRRISLLEVTRLV
ncbi:MAG: TerC family protein [Castellaniella sp.]|uniref:TerC family protein n=1 Tax=Castellaniella sp. TaxID=1955812 RepID=UPI003C732F6D